MSKPFPSVCCHPWRAVHMVLTQRNCLHQRKRDSVTCLRIHGRLHCSPGQPLKHDLCVTFSVCAHLTPWATTDSFETISRIVSFAECHTIAITEYVPFQTGCCHVVTWIYDSHMAFCDLTALSLIAEKYSITCWVTHPPFKGRLGCFRFGNGFSGCEHSHTDLGVDI